MISELIPDINKFLPVAIFKMCYLTSERFVEHLGEPTVHVYI
jgi:hypothetical protein